MVTTSTIIHAHNRQLKLAGAAEKKGYTGKMLIINGYCTNFLDQYTNAQRIHLKRTLRSADASRLIQSNTSAKLAFAESTGSKPITL